MQWVLSLRCPEIFSLFCEAIAVRLETITSRLEAIGIHRVHSKNPIVLQLFVNQAPWRPWTFPAILGPQLVLLAVLKSVLRHPLPGYTARAPPGDWGVPGGAGTSLRNALTYSDLVWIFADPRHPCQGTSSYYICLWNKSRYIGESPDQSKEP